MKGYRRVAFLLILGWGILLLDFLSKAYVYYVPPFSGTCGGMGCTQIPIFQNFLGVDFSIVLTLNRGAAWGILADFQIPLLILRIAVITGMLIYLFFFKHRRIVEVPLVLIVAGALGNIADFFLYGSVIDFLSFNLWGYRFPIFNLADSVITIGVVGLFVVTFFGKKKMVSRV